MLLVPGILTWLNISAKLRFCGIYYIFKFNMIDSHLAINIFKSPDSAKYNNHFKLLCYQLYENKWLYANKNWYHIHTVFSRSERKHNTLTLLLAFMLHRWRDVNDFEKISNLRFFCKTHAAHSTWWNEPIW